MMMQSSPTPIPVLAVIILGFFIQISQCLRFDLQSGNPKCFVEDIKINSMTVGKYHVVNPHDGANLPDTHKITVRVTSSTGKNYHHLAERVESGQFAFTAEETAVYVLCMWMEDDHKPPITVTVEFEWKMGVAAKDWGAVAKKGSIVGMETELKKLMDTVGSIHEEMFDLRSREEEMQGLNRSTNSKMFWLSFTSFFVCFSVASLQFWHLKSFFVRKKLL